MKSFLRITVFVFGLLLAGAPASAASAGAPPESARSLIVRAILTEGSAAKRQLIGQLVGRDEPEIPVLLEAWRNESLCFLDGPDGQRIPVRLLGDKDAAEPRTAERVIDGAPVLDAQGRPRRFAEGELSVIDITTPLKSAMRPVLDGAELSSPDVARRLAAVDRFGKSQGVDKLVPLRKRLEVEPVASVQAALREAVALVQLKDPDDTAKITGLDYLRDHPSQAARSFVVTALQDAQGTGKADLIEAARRAVVAADRHLSRVDFFGFLFRSVSLGSILLVVALGLSITFGLMGVINMAHGEMIAVGAYTTYVVQCVFGPGLSIPLFGLGASVPGLNLKGAAFDSYFAFAIPLSFLVAAFVGILLERSVIRFLYRRPLESLLATWGVSLVMQQTMKFTFGSNNVQVSSPSWLSGNWTINDILLGWNRVFVIGFVIVIVFGVWLVLTKTSLGLLMRSVMQNRTMASCMGVRTERVNMLTFGLGSGLAGLAGAFLSQIGNVGPSLGQGYIVDSFMVVVVGGVGSIAGTAIAAFGIGTVDQGLQQYAGLFASVFASVPGVGGFLQNLAQDSAVFGKITVLCGIILFLQWRPAGIFVTRSRSLEG